MTSAFVSPLKAIDLQARGYFAQVDLADLAEGG